MCNSFVSDFFANFLSDLIVGILFGIVVAWWIGVRLNLRERIQQHTDEKKTQLEKAISFLNQIWSEVNYIVERLPVLAEKANKIMTGSGMTEVELYIPMPIWDINKPSGELPKLPINPTLLAELAKFYDYLDFAKQGINRYLFKSNPQTSDMQSFQVTIQFGFTEANQKGNLLPNKIKTELERLNNQLLKLSLPRSKKESKTIKD